MSMLMVALFGLGSAWLAGRQPRVAVVDLGAPNVVAVGGRPQTLSSLPGYLRGSRAREVVIRSPSDMPYDAVVRVCQAIEAAGIRQIRLSAAPASPGPVQPPSRPNAAGPVRVHN
jgi:hypothetical protein